MSCRICGNTKARYCSTKLQYLCKTCNQGTSPKVSRSCFEAVYWAAEGANAVPNSTRTEFYQDYLSYKGTLAEYIEATSVPC